MSSSKQLKERNGVILWEMPPAQSGSERFVFRYKVTRPPPARERLFSTHAEAEQYFNEAAAQYETSPETD